MPKVRIVNETTHTLNIALSQIAPLHFENEIRPGDAFQARTGSVWFTVEWRIDNIPPKTLQLTDKKALQKAITHSNRYSASKSARTIAIVTAAGLSLLVLAGPVALSAAAAAGSATAASLLASSSILAAAGTAEAVAFSSYAATTLTASALDAITEDAGIAPETSERAKKQLDILSTVVSTASVSGAALKGPRKAVMSAGTALISKMATRSNKKAVAEADTFVKENLLPAGTTERVYAVYIGFGPRNFAIRQMKDDAGAAHLELWDTDKDKRMI